MIEEKLVLAWDRKLNWNTLAVQRCVSSGCWNVLDGLQHCRGQNRGLRISDDLGGIQRVLLGDAKNFEKWRSLGHLVVEAILFRLPLGDNIKVQIARTNCVGPIKAQNYACLLTSSQKQAEQGSIPDLVVLSRL